MSSKQTCRVRGTGVLGFLQGHTYLAEHEGRVVGSYILKA